MPTLDQNLRFWGRDFRWDHRGDEWSNQWGFPEAQWACTVFPRISAFLPAASILEIGAGFGRWSHFLKDYCKQLTVVDLAPRCIEACRERFKHSPHFQYYVNDGKSLSMIPDRSVNFVFSFDSLVHAEADVIEAYLDQLARKLAPDGAGFIHHSSIGSFPSLVFVLRAVPLRLRGFLMRKNVLPIDHWRAYSMTATRFERFCEKAGLQCIGQEQIGWGGERLIDCFSSFTLKHSKWARPNKVISNPEFMEEARRAVSGASDLKK